MQTLEIHERKSSETIPWNLLLSADPSKELVEQYLLTGQLYLAFIDNELIGEYVLTRNDPNTIELKNIAIIEDRQGKGFGKTLVLDAIARAKKQKVKQIIVGTGNSSLSQLALYQKCGFRITGIEKDFFTKNYSEKIVENGIECKDMVRLSVKFLQ